MIDMLSRSITRMIRYYCDEVTEEKEEIINYGINLFIYEIITILLVFIPSVILDFGKEMIVMFIVYGLLRISAGGAHARTRFVCIITYLSSAFGTVFLANYLQFSNLFLSAIVYSVCLFIILKYAPGDTVEKPILDIKLRKKLKVIALCIVVILFLSSVIAWAFDQETYNIIIISPIPAMTLLTPFGYKMLRCHQSCVPNT